MTESILDRLRRELPDTWWQHSAEERQRDQDAAAWFAIHTRPGWEASVDRLLKLRGFSRRFYPHQLVKRWRKAAGKAQRQEEIERPYMPRYTFVRCLVSEVGEVNRIAGVSTVVHIDGYPLTIPDRVMLALMANADPDGLFGLDDRTRRARGFKGRVGDHVAFADASPLSGFVATIASVASLDAKGEISVWLEMFGARRKVPVSVEYVAGSAAA